MIELVPLCTVSLQLAPALAVGTGAAGDRSVGGFLSATIEGERLRGELAGPGADWLVRTGTIGAIDVRMTIRTHDGALVHVSYNGRLDLSDPKNGITAYVAPLFETGDERYAWLNRIQAVGKGKLAVTAQGATLVYDYYEVR